MTEHLPECILPPYLTAVLWGRAPQGLRVPCICEQLRACEQRMREEHRHRCAGCDWCYSDGVREALDAAREATKEFFETTPSDGQIEAWIRQYGESAWFEEAALAAIDALRGES